MQPDPQSGKAVQSNLALRLMAKAEEFRECRRLAMDATPMTAGERARDEWNVRGKGNG